MKNIGVIIITYCVFNCGAVFAKTTDDTQSWISVLAHRNIKPEHSVFFQAEQRIRDSIGTSDRFFIRPGYDYHLNDWAAVGVGYTWFHAYHTPASKDDEHQSWEQFTMNHEVAPGLKMVNRFRLEQRFIENLSGMSLRQRYFLRFTYPLTWMENLKAVVWNEVFFNLNDKKSGPESGFDQNRFFLGVNKGLNKHFGIEMGYMNGFINISNSDNNKINHVVMIALIVT